MREVSLRADSIRPFIAMDVMARARELEAAGRDIVHLEIGDPDLPTPEVVVQAAEEAMNAGETGYTQAAGLPDLRDAVSYRMRKDHSVDVAPGDVIVTQGTSPAMLLLFGSLLDPGDEVIMADPCYPAYPNCVSFLDGVPVPVRVRAEDGFRLRASEVEQAITPRTKAIILNSPSNPTGGVLEPEDMQALADIAMKHGLWLASDEIYQGLQFEGRPHTVLEFTDRAFVLSGFSKSYAMTGWRLGYLIAPHEFVRPAEKIQQNFFLCASNFVQVAGTVALLRAEDEVARMRAVYDERRRYLVPALREVGLEVAVEPKGAFYVFGDARAWDNDSVRLTSRLLEEAGVAVAPGLDFGQGGEGFLRLSYATSIERLKEGVRRLGYWAGSGRGKA